MLIERRAWKRRPQRAWTAHTCKTRASCSHQVLWRKNYDSGQFRHQTFSLKLKRSSPLNFPLFRSIQTIRLYILECHMHINGLLCLVVWYDQAVWVSGPKFGTFSASDGNSREIRLLSWKFDTPMSHVWALGSVFFLVHLVSWKSLLFSPWIYFCVVFVRFILWPVLDCCSHLCVPVEGSEPVMADSRAWPGATSSNIRVTETGGYSLARVILSIQKHGPIFGTFVSGFANAHNAAKAPDNMQKMVFANWCVCKPTRKCSRYWLRLISFNWCRVMISPGHLHCADRKYLNVLDICFIFLLWSCLCA